MLIVLIGFCNLATLYLNLLRTYYACPKYAMDADNFEKRSCPNVGISVSAE